MKKKKIVKLNIDCMPLNKFIEVMINKLSDIPCNAKVELFVDKDDNPYLGLSYYKNECKEN